MGPGHLTEKVDGHSFSEDSQGARQRGSGMSGQVFVEATSRIQDLLNAPEPFFPFVDETGIVHLINKSAVIQITPHD